MFTLKRSLMLCSLLAVIALSEPSFSKNFTEQVVQKIEFQSKDQSKTDVGKGDKDYFNAACACATAFAKDVGKQGGKFLMTKAIENAPQLIEFVCGQLVGTLCGADFKCNLQEAIQIEKFADQYYGTASCPIS